MVNLPRSLNYYRLIQYFDADTLDVAFDDEDLGPVVMTREPREWGECIVLRIKGYVIANLYADAISVTLASLNVASEALWLVNAIMLSHNLLGQPVIICHGDQDYWLGVNNADNGARRMTNWQRMFDEDGQPVNLIFVSQDSQNYLTRIH